MSSIPRLSDMNLRIGQPVQLVLQGPVTYKHYSRLIGFFEPDFVMVRIPMEQGWAVHVHNGQAISIRLLSDVSIIEFNTTVQTFQLHPRNFMVLDYPSSVKETRYRAHERVKCHLPVNIIQPPPGHTTDFYIQDLSGGGVALVGPRALGQPGSTVEFELSFELQATGTQECLRLQGDIQSIEPVDSSSGFSGLVRHGVRFRDTDPRLFLLVYELQKNRR